MKSSSGLWPTFIGIGPGRTATTTIYHALREHPQICMARNTKETNFFNHQYALGADWYQTFFSDCDPAGVRGEISNTYFYDERVPGRIAALLPDVLLISTLRNPFSRIYSAYLYQKSSGELDGRLTFAEAILTHPELVQQNNYADILERFLAHFRREQMLIVFYDDLKADPDAFICRLFDFIGVDPQFRSREIHNYYNEMVEARLRMITLFAHRLAHTLRRRQWYAWLNRAKQAGWLRPFFYRQLPAQMARMTPEQWEMLAEIFVPQIQRVEQLTGRNLQHWYAQ